MAKVTTISPSSWRMHALLILLLLQYMPFQVQSTYCDSILPPVPTCVEQKPRDLLFLVDGSQSMNRDRFFREMLDYCLSLYCAFDRDQTNQAGLIVFNDKLTTYVPLNAYSQDEWFAEVEAVRATKDSPAPACCSCCTPTAEAFDAARDEFAIRGRNAVRVAFTITDGVPSNNFPGTGGNPAWWFYNQSAGLNPATYNMRIVPERANILKNDGVRIFLVGVPDRDGNPPEQKYFNGLLAENSLQCTRRGLINYCDRYRKPPFPIVSLPINKNSFSSTQWNVQQLITQTIGALCDIPPTGTPTWAPTDAPSPSPTTTRPTKSPIVSRPSTAPSGNPTSSRPSSKPTMSPSTVKPSKTPSITPTISLPTRSPSRVPTSSRPSRSPSRQPTTSSPSLSPSASPTTSKPSKMPSRNPIVSWPTNSPSHKPTFRPSASPTFSPTITPTGDPTVSPTFIPTRSPTRSPTHFPSRLPTQAPTAHPSTSPTASPSTSQPTSGPSTSRPTSSPSFGPTNRPTRGPSTKNPTRFPSTTKQPTSLPSTHPTAAPVIVNLEQLDLTFIVDRSMSMKWHDKVCAKTVSSSPMVFPLSSKPSTSQCWELFMRYVLAQADAIASVRAGVFMDRALGWADDFEQNVTPAKGLRVNVIGFSCDNKQRTPKAFFYTKDMLGGPATNRDQLTNLLDTIRTTVTPNGGTCPGLAIEQAVRYIESTPERQYPLHAVVLLTDGVFYDGDAPSKATAGLAAYKALRFAVGIAVANGAASYGMSAKEIKTQRMQLNSFVGSENGNLFKDLGSSGWETLPLIARKIAEDLPDFYFQGVPIPRYTWCGWRRIATCKLDKWRMSKCKWPNTKKQEYGCRRK